MNQAKDSAKQRFIGAPMFSTIGTFVLIGCWTVLVLSLAPAERAEPRDTGFSLIFPMVMRNRAIGLGFEINVDNGYMFPELADFNPRYIRSHFASWYDPYDTLYQHYISGGWAEVDQEVVTVLGSWRGIGAEPIVIFMHGESCHVPSYQELAAYGDFISAAAERYDLRHFEVWNEPDASAGVTSVWGCFGTAYADRLIYLLERVQAQVDPWREVGVSFMVDNASHMEMLAAVAPSADWIGIHHYGVWGGGVIMEPWPGSLQLKYEMARSASPVPVWLTEYNLRSPDYYCTQAHQQAQANYLLAAFNLEIPMVSIHIYADYPDWQCTGIRDTPASQVLLNMPP